MLLEARGLLDPVTFKRAQHVVAEIARPRDMAVALRDGDLNRCGTLMADSHWSLRDLYEVSCQELDFITGLAASHPACYGARLTGAGFGGCAVALVDAAQSEAFVDSVAGAYGDRVDLLAAFHVCRPVSGVTVQ
jgi:galactokinase